jgi:hypothetical protein
MFSEIDCSSSNTGRINLESEGEINIQDITADQLNSALEQLNACISKPFINREECIDFLEAGGLKILLRLLPPVDSRPNFCSLAVEVLSKFVKFFFFFEVKMNLLY